MENILDITSIALRGDVLSQLSTQMRETPSATRRGIESAVPISVAALAQHASSDQKAEELLGTLRGGGYPHIDPGNVTQMVADPESTTRLSQSGKGFLGRIFGTRLNGVIEALAGQAGLSRDSASTLLGFATPLVLNAVGKEAETRNLDARGLSRFLADQGRRATSALPGPLSSALALKGPGPALGATGTTEHRSGFGERARGRASEAVHKVEQRGAELRHAHPPKKNVWWAILGAGLLALLALLMFGRRERDATQLEAVTPDIDVPGAVPRPDMAPPQEMPARPEAPAGVQQQQQQAAEPPAQAAPKPAPEPAAPATARAIEVLSPASGAAALTTLLDGDATLPQRFELQGVEFSTASAAVPRNTMLDEVAAALEKKDDARIRLEGFTDSTGPAELNQQLSQQRAQAVKGYLVARGISADRIEAVGRGAMPKTDTAQGESPAEERRVELVVLER